MSKSMMQMMEMRGKCLHGIALSVRNCLFCLLSVRIFYLVYNTGGNLN